MASPDTGDVESTSRFWDPDGWIDVTWPPTIDCPICGEGIEFGVQMQSKEGVMALRAVLDAAWLHSFQHEQREDEEEPGGHA